MSSAPDQNVSSNEDASRLARRSSADLRKMMIHEATDAMIDAGYQIHVESAVENGGDYPDDAVAPVSATPQQVAGTGYVGRLTVSM